MSPTKVLTLSFLLGLLDSLVLLTWERRRGPSAKSDDVLAMLEEETEALVASGYAPVLQREPMGDE